MNQIQLTQVAELNDRFRKGDFSLGMLSMSPKVEALSNQEKQTLLQAVGKVDNFIETKATNSSKLHEFGLVTHHETEYIWEIDYCDKQLKSISPNPADPNCTSRILTLMRIDEF